MANGNWYVVLEGPVKELEKIAQFGGKLTHCVLQIDPSKIGNLEAEDQYLFSSDLLKQLGDDEYEKAKNIAKILIGSLSGTCALFFGTRMKISTEKMLHISDDGNTSTLMHEPEGWLQPGAKTIKATDASDYISLGAQYEAVSTVLRLYGSGEHNLVNWYRIYEVIKRDVGGDRNMVLGNISNDDLERFRHTANSVSASGDLSRHGVEHTQPPANPMDEVEALEFIRELVGKWVEGKL